MSDHQIPAGTPPTPEAARGAFPSERLPVLYAANPGFLKVAAQFAANGALFTKGVEEVTEFGDGDELPVADSEQNLATLGRIAETGAGHLFPGHGEPWHGPAEEAVAIARRNGTR